MISHAEETPGPLCAFDVTALQQAESSGVARYVRELARALQSDPRGWRFGALASRPLTQAGAALGMPMLSGPTRGRRLIWMQTQAPGVLRRARPAVAHFTNMVAPLRAPCPIVLTIHDASLVRHPELHSFRHWLAVRPLLPLMARRADAVITVSRSAREDIVSILGVKPDRAHVVYSAPPAHYLPVRDEARLRMIRERYALPERFFLFVGTLEPRKNALALIEAIAIARRTVPDIALVMVGPLGWKYEKTLARIDALGLGQAILRLGFVVDADLPPLYSLCEAIVYPSRYEGFGFPIVEGMACGAPVITSNASAMREIAADAAILVQPGAPDALARAMLDVRGSPALAASLRARGRVRSADFSWARAAGQTLDVYEDVVARRAARMIHGA
jgi:glycosyltransferase involved in cell wall biosynthesis